MTLRDLRIEFVKRCGRYDLVTTDSEEDEWGDNGANFYIQAGQRFLDRQGDWGTGQFGTYYAGLARGQHSLLVAQMWGLSSVRYRLGHWHPEVWQEVKAVHSREALSCRCPREPLYYLQPLRRGPKARRAADMQQPASGFTFGSSMDEPEDEGIWLHFVGLPYKDYAVSLMLTGHFYSASLKEDDDDNYWSTRYPETLLKASLYELEIFYRNREGAADWLAAVQEDMLSIQEQELFTSINTQPSEMGL